MKKQILVGADSFEKIIEGNFFYVDKTLFIKELLENRGEVTLITRPRRFGKTMNMRMLESFFDISRDSKALFDGLKIMEHEDIVEKYLNKYPVIFLSLKNDELVTYENPIKRIKALVSAVFQQHLYLCEGGRLDEFRKKRFNQYCSEEATEVDLHTALQFLTACMYDYYQKRVIVLLDDYDAPIAHALVEGFYDEIIGIMRGLLGSAFKTNNYLEFGVLAGAQRIPGERLFGSINNALFHGIMDKSFATCFGFTEDEVKDACTVYCEDDNYDEVKMWYNGYRFGGQDMYNPWSITQYLQKQEFDNYWVNSGLVRILEDVFYKGDDKLRDDLAGLLTGTPIEMSLWYETTYPLKFANSNAFWTLFLYAGYIKPCNGAKAGTFKAELVNMEVVNIFSRYAEDWFLEQQPSASETGRASQSPSVPSMA